MCIVDLRRRCNASPSIDLTIHQFLQTDQSAGSPQMACRQV